MTPTADGSSTAATRGDCGVMVGVVRVCDLESGDLFRGGAWDVVSRTTWYRSVAQVLRPDRLATTTSWLEATEYQRAVSVLLSVAEAIW